MTDSSSTVSGDQDVPCPWCGHSLRTGLRVCVGCQADVVYGATKRELTKAFKFGFLVALVAQIPTLPWIEKQFDLGWSLLVVPIVGAVIGGALLSYLRARWLSGKPRFFRRTAL